MNTIGNYFTKKQDQAISLKDNMVVGKRYRFTILTDRLIRLEYSPNGTFEDRPTQRVIFRHFPQVKFQKTHTEMLLQVITSYFTLNYVKEKPFGSGKLTPGNNLKITLNQSDRAWYYGNPEVRNFGGLTFSLDDFKGTLKLGKGLYSTDGFAVLDDSSSLVLDANGNFVKREQKEIDIYVFMYRKDLGLCLQDYYTLTGYPMLIPRYALGNWWYKDEEYNKNKVEELVKRFREQKIPLAGLILSTKCFADNDFLTMKPNVFNQGMLKQYLATSQVHLGTVVNPSLKIGGGTQTYQSIQQSIPNLKGNFSFLPITTDKLNLLATYGIRNYIQLGSDTFYIDYNANKDKETLALLNHYCYAMPSLLLNKRSMVLSRYHSFAMHRMGIVFYGKN